MTDRVQFPENVDMSPEAITRAPLTAGNRVKNDIPDDGIDGVLSIDKLAFTFDLPRERWDTFRRWMYRHGSPQRGGRIYREGLKLADPVASREYVLIQWAPYLLGSVPFVRVEFNPAKALGFRDVLTGHILPFLEREWSAVHITRIDVAIDYPVALQEHVYFAGNHKGAIYYAHGIETIYLGAAQSDTRLRIYDKAKELAVTGEPVPEHPLTRIEAQRRSTGLSGADVDCLRNPFERLQISRPTPVGLPYRFDLYLKEAEAHGADYVVKRLTRAERKHFKDVLATMPPTVRHPKAVFAAKYPAFCLIQLPIFFGWKIVAPAAEDTDRGCSRPLAA